MLSGRWSSVGMGGGEGDGRSVVGNKWSGVDQTLSSAGRSGVQPAHNAQVLVSDWDVVNRQPTWRGDQALSP